MAYSCLQTNAMCKFKFGNNPFTPDLFHKNFTTSHLAISLTCCVYGITLNICRVDFHDRNTWNTVELPLQEDTNWVYLKIKIHRVYLFFGALANKGILKGGILANEVQLGENRRFKYGIL